MPLFLAGKTTQIDSDHTYFTKPLTITPMIALPVVRASSGFRLRWLPTVQSPCRSMEL